MSFGVNSEMHKPHICFVAETQAAYGLLTGADSSTGIGGAEVQQMLLSPALRKLGYTVSFLVPDLGQPEEVVTESGFRLIKTREQYKSTGIGGQIRDLRLLFRAMNRAGADIYYQRTSVAVTGITALYCKLKKKPFVFSVASNMELDGTTRRLLGELNHRIYWYGLTHATAVVVQTEDQMRLLKEVAGKDGVLIRSTFPEPDEPDTSVERRYVLWVGSFRDVRRPEMFVELASRLPQYEFVMVGGPWKSQESMFDEMKSRAERIGNLHLTGPIPYGDVGRQFGGAKVFVNTSSAEGFPNTYLQSWSRGLPVIATFDADGLIVKHGLGRYCESIDEMVRAVDEFMRDDALCASVGESALRYARENHRLEVIAAQYDELFMRLYEAKR